MSPRRSHDEESQVRVRANPRGSRPRTKDRPRHADAVPAQVVTVDRGRYGCLLGGFEAPPDSPVVVAMKARELGRAAVLVGDRVAVVGDVSGAAGSLARIVRVEPRTSMLRRSADDTDPVERAVVANADQLAVVTALADPEPRPRMVDRCLVAAYDGGLDPLLVLTKADLRDPAEFTRGYAALEVPWLVTSRTSPSAPDGLPGFGDGGTAPSGGSRADTSGDGDRSGPAGTEPAAPVPGPADSIVGLEAVREHLTGRVTVLIGHSGVGKSTLVNALVPGADRAIGRVNDHTGRGRHTSTSAVALRLPEGGWVIDTPGVRSFGLAHVEADRLLRAFPELAAGTDECPRGCTHDEEECGLDDWAASGRAGPSAPARLESFRRLLRARSGATDV